MRKKKIVLLIVSFLILCSSARAWNITDTLIRSEGLNSQVGVNNTEYIVLENLSVRTDSITFTGVNYTNKLQTGNYTYTINFTEQNKNYTNPDLPYVTSHTSTQLVALSNLIGNTSTIFTTKLTRLCIELYRIQFISNLSNFDYNYSVNSEITCDNRSASVNVTLEKGNNIFSYLFTSISNITFRHEDTDAIIDNTVMNLEIIGENVDYSRNYTTTTGNISAGFVTPGTYTLRYFGNDYYDERFHYLDLTANSSVRLTLYVNENTTLTHITVSVLDENSDPVEDAEVRMYRYDIDTNTYLLVEEGRTNFEGETRLQVEYSGEFYKFQVWYDDEMKKETSPSYIWGDTLTVYINLQDVFGQRFEDLLGITYSLEFSEGDNRFDGSYADSSGDLERGCLNVFRMSNSGRTLFNQSCSTDASRILYVGVANVSGRRYLAQVEVMIDGKNTVVTEVYYKYGSGEGKDLVGSSGLFVALILMLTFAGLGAVYKSGISMILAPIPLLALSLLGVITLSPGIPFGLVVIGAIIGGIMMRK